MAKGMKLDKAELEHLSNQPNTHVYEMEERPIRPTRIPAKKLGENMVRLHRSYIEGLMRFGDASDDQLRHILRFRMLEPEIMEIANDLYTYNRMCFIKLTDRHAEGSKWLPYFQFMVDTLELVEAGEITSSVGFERCKRKGKELRLHEQSSAQGGGNGGGGSESRGTTISATINIGDVPSK
jgi:hypothetical protein